MVPLLKFYFNEDVRASAAQVRCCIDIYLLMADLP